MNIASYYKQLNKLNYKINTVLYNLNPSLTTTQTYNSSLSPPKQCNPLKNSQLFGSNCVPITSCVLGILNAQYCSADNTPIVCASTYHFGKYTLIKFYI
jgi:hypothetical protein